MWCRLGLCVVLGACGFRSEPGAGGGGDDAGSNRSDAGVADGAVDSPAAADTCWPHWMDGTVAIVPDSAKEITELTAVGVNRNPWISSDGMTMYFTRDLGDANGTDIYVATRTRPTGTFDGGTRVTNVSTADQENRVWLTSDGLTIAISSDHQVTPRQLEIHMDVRAPNSAGFATPTATHLAKVNSPGTERDDPWISDDGLHLYWAANSNSGRLQILTATRADAGADFGSPSPVGGFRTDDNMDFADPTLYQNEQLMVFSAFPDVFLSTADLWYARRANATGDFGAMTKIPVDVDSESEIDPVLSADGCDLYYASNHGHSTVLQLFHARIVK